MGVVRLPCASFWSQTSGLILISDKYLSVGSSYMILLQLCARRIQVSPGKRVIYDVLDPWTALFARCKRLSPWSWTLWSTVIWMYITHVFVHFHLCVFLVLILMALFFEIWHTFHLYILINWSCLSTIHRWILKQHARRLAKQAWQFASQFCTSTCQKKLFWYFYYASSALKHTLKKNYNPVAKK